MGGTQVESNERNISAMQRGDDTQLDAIACEDLLGKVAADGMRDCVVDVQQFELFVASDVNNFACQRERVKLVLHERIAWNFDLVEANVLPKPIQARWQRIRDEVHAPATRSQCHPKLGCNDPTTTVGWIADNANVHFHSTR